MAQQTVLGHALLIIKASRSHSATHTHSVGLLCTSDQPEEVTSTSQHTTLTRDNHAPGEIRTRNPSKQMASDSFIRPRGRWDRLKSVILDYI
jgi:hypothetical protein